MATGEFRTDRRVWLIAAGCLFAAFGFVNPSGGTPSEDHLWAAIAPALAFHALAAAFLGWVVQAVIVLVRSARPDPESGSGSVAPDLPVADPDAGSDAGGRPIADIRVVRRAAIEVAAIVALTNFGMFALFSHGRAGGAMLILANLALMFMGTVGAPQVESDSGGASLKAYALAVFGAPFIAAAIGVCIIVAYGMGGC